MSAPVRLEVPDRKTQIMYKNLFVYNSSFDKGHLSKY